MHNMLLDELAHAAIARSARFPPEDNRHNVPVIAAHRRYQIVSGGFGVAGLDSVHSLNLAQERVVVVYVLSAIAEAHG
jgi:hypothetical protein